MSVKRTLFTAALALASATYSPFSLSEEVEVDANNKPTNVKIDSIPEISVTCYRCDELARKYLSSQTKADDFIQPIGIQHRIISQEIEEAE